MSLSDEGQEIQGFLPHVAPGDELRASDSARLDSKRDFFGMVQEGGDIIRTRFPPEPNGYLHIGLGTLPFGGACDQTKGLRRSQGL